MNVFVSRPTWLHESFRQGLDVFLTRLNDLDLIPHTLGATDYPTKAPLDEVIQLLDKCRGAVILGYPQIEIEAGSLRDRRIEARILLPTEWNHIEAGLAYARRLPLLVIHHIGIARGIFDRGALNSFLFERDLQDPTWAVGEDISGAIRSWRDNVLGFAPTPQPQRNTVYEGLEKNKNIVWTVQATGRRIADSRPAGGHRESAECRIEELTEYYARIRILASDLFVTIPLGDIVISFDDKRHRPMIELRA